MPKSECKELSLKWVQENQRISCVFTHCAPPLVIPGKNPSKFYQVRKRIKKRSKEKNIPPKDKREQKSIFENQCQCVGFCSSWIQIHVISPAINILNLGPKTVCPGTHKLSIWLLQQRKAFMTNFAQKSRIWGISFLRKDWIYHDTYFTKKPVKWTTFLPKPQKRQIPLLEELAAPVEKINLCWGRGGGRSG